MLIFRITSAETFVFYRSHQPVEHLITLSLISEQTKLKVHHLILMISVVHHVEIRIYKELCLNNHEERFVTQSTGFL